jgi:hypothetical protein
MRPELEELLGLKDKTKLGDAESQPLLLSVVESYLKAEEKPTATANKVRTNSRGRAGDAGDGVLMSKLSGEFSKDNGKGGTKLSPNLEDFPAPKRTSRQVFYIISINYGTLCQLFFHAKFAVVCGLCGECHFFHCCAFFCVTIFNPQFISMSNCL